MSADAVGLGLLAVRQGGRCENRQGVLRIIRGRSVKDQVKPGTGRTRVSDSDSGGTGGWHLKGTWGRYSRGSDRRHERG